LFIEWEDTKWLRTQSIENSVYPVLISRALSSKCPSPSNKKTFTLSPRLSLKELGAKTDAV